MEEIQWRITCLKLNYFLSLKMSGKFSFLGNDRHESGCLTLSAQCTPQKYIVVENIQKFTEFLLGECFASRDSCQKVVLKPNTEVPLYYDVIIYGRMVIGYATHNEQHADIRFIHGDLFDDEHNEALCDLDEQKRSDLINAINMPNNDSSLSYLVKFCIYSDIVNRWISQFE